jgi:hypothetical protein
MIFVALALTARADMRSLPDVEVQSSPVDQDIIGPYDQPRWTARGRFSSDTDIYVLPPYSFYVDLDYNGTFPRTGSDATHLFTQELEVGLPHRFQLAFENNVEFTRQTSQVTVETIEARYALADWGKLPLNPTLFAEYHFGVGKEFEMENGKDGEMEESDIPDSIEARLLFGEQFGRKYQWALNIFHEFETGGAREWESGFSQAITYAIHDERLKVGIEMQGIRRTESDTRSHPKYEFDIGPSFTWKPSAITRFDIATLVGVTHDSPTTNIFAVFSIAFGNGADDDEAPLSSRHN